MIADTTIPYEDIDKEIVDLCKAFNDIDGIETVESCCGHGKETCYILFMVRDIETLNRLCFHCFNHEGFWEIQVDLGDPHRDWNELYLCLISKRICKQSDFDRLANRIRKRKQDMLYSNDEWKSLRSLERYKR